MIGHPARDKTSSTAGLEQERSRKRFSATIRGVKAYSLVGIISSKEIVVVDDTTAIVPVRGDSILLVGQYRMCVGKYLLEVPGGRIAKGETPEEAARRELLEETGYKAGKMEELIRFYRAPSYSTQNVHVFLATDLVQVYPESDEWAIDLKWVKIKDVLGMIRRGEIEDGRTIAAFLYYMTLKGA